MSGIHYSRFSPLVGGHAPGDLRSAFDNNVELIEHGIANADTLVDIGRKEMIPFRKLCGLLWNCTDILPRWIYDLVKERGEVRRQTYGAAARVMKTL